MDAEVPELEARLEALGGDPEHAAQRVDTLIELAWALRRRDPDRALALVTDARGLAIEIGYKLGQARAARTLAMALGRVTGAMRDMLTYAEEARALFDEVGDRVGSAASRDFLSSLYEAMGDLSTAMELAHDALELAREADSPARQGWALSNIGGILAATGDVAGAFERLGEALALFERGGDAVGIQRICARLGRLCADADRDEEALVFTERRLELANRHHDAYDQALSLALLGQLRMKAGELDEAERLYRQSVDINADHEPRSVMGIPAQVTLAQLLTRRGALSEAREVLERALERMQRVDFAWSDEAPLREALAEVCERQGEPQRASAHLRAAIELERRKAERETREKLAQFEVRAEAKAAKQEAEIHRLRYVELSQMQAKLIEAEKMAQLGMIAAGTAHEINNPLGVLRSNLGVYAKAAELLTQPASPERDKRVARLGAVLAGCERTSEEAIARIASVADNFRRFTQLDQADRRSFDVNEGLQSALSLLAPNVRAGVRLEHRLEPVPAIDGWPAALNQAFMTVLSNAVDAIEGEGVVTVWTETTTDAVRVHVRDTGRGMDETKRARLFDVAWSEEGARTKMRLGLLAVHTTVERHGGTVAVDSAQGAGTTFTFSFPVGARDR